MSIFWDNIENTNPFLSYELKKGDQVILKIQFDAPVDDFNKAILSSFINEWWYPSKGKNIRPFKQLDVSITGNLFEASILIQKKDKEIDEFKLFCQDVLDILDSDNIHVVLWSLSKVYTSTEEFETMTNNQDITVPSLSEIEAIALQHHFSLNTDINPYSGFEIYNKKTQSGFSSMMTEDLSLFSIDVYNPTDNEMINVLSEILECYRLPVSQLKQDLINFNMEHREILTNYSDYWVSYRPSENEEDALFMRYRRFV